MNLKTKNFTTSSPRTIRQGLPPLRSASNLLLTIAALVFLSAGTSSLSDYRPAPDIAAPNDGVQRKVFSKDQAPAPLPLHVSDEMVLPLRTLQSESLQLTLDGIIEAHPLWTRLKQQKRMSIGLVDLRDTLNVRFAHINGDHMMYAASLPKIAILLAAMDAIESGDLEETPEVKTDMRLMIAKSNNGAATRMIDRVGFDRIAQVMQDPDYELYDNEEGGGLWVGKRYASSGKRVGDPIKNISHGASATQVCRFYYMLAFGKLVNYDRSKQMLGYLGDPELHHKFVNTLDDVAPKAKVFRKSGSWKQYHSDSALVWGTSWRRYILVALVEDEGGEQMLRDMMEEVDKSLKPS